MSEFMFYVVICFFVALVAEIMNGVDYVLETNFPVKEATDKPLPPKYIVKELTNRD